MAVGLVINNRTSGTKAKEKEKGSAINASITLARLRTI